MRERDAWIEEGREKGREGGEVGIEKGRNEGNEKLANVRDWYLIFIHPVNAVVEFLKKGLAASCRPFVRGQMKRRTFILISVRNENSISV